MKRPVLILAAAAATLGTAAADSGCWPWAGNWTASIARGKTSGSYYVLDTFGLKCWSTPDPDNEICLWDHVYSARYQYQPGSNVWIGLDTSKADHSHTLLCAGARTVNLEKHSLGTICGPRPGVAVEVTDYLWTGPIPIVRPGGVVPNTVKIKRWRFKCPPLVVGPGPEDEESHFP